MTQLLLLEGFYALSHDFAIVFGEIRTPCLCIQHDLTDASVHFREVPHITLMS